MADQKRVRQVRSSVAETSEEKIEKSSFKFPLTLILVIVLVGAAYYIGTLRTELGQLKKEKGSVASATSDVSGSSKATAPLPQVGDGDHIRGDRSAKVILVEYSDLECPFCKRFHPTLAQVLADYDGDVAWVYRHYPLSFHANAQKEAEAAECAGELGGNDKFWEFADKVFERTTAGGTGFALEKLGPLAAEIGLNQGQFQECLDSGKYTKQVQDEMAAGKAAGVSGTPTTFIVANGKTSKPISGALPLSEVKKAIDQVLK